jgi:hypothetical protein
VISPKKWAFLEKEEQKFFEGSKEPISYNRITNSKLYLLKEEVLIIVIKVYTVGKL